MGRPEDSRVKIPALVHFTRLGYRYMSIKDKVRGLDYDPDTNIFYAEFMDPINRINGTSVLYHPYSDKSSHLIVHWIAYSVVLSLKNYSMKFFQI